MTKAPPFSQVEKLARKIARQVHRRMVAAGCDVVSVNDVFQEAAIAWCIARDRYDGSVPFPPYFARGCYQHLNRWAEKEIKQRVGHLRLDHAVGDEDDALLHEIIADERQEDPIEGIRRHQIQSRLIAGLSHRAQTFLRLLDSPPPELFEELQALQARAAHARDRGINAVAPRHITSNMVLTLMGIGPQERTSIYRELKRVAAKISN